MALRKIMLYPIIFLPTHVTFPELEPGNSCPSSLACAIRQVPRPQSSEHNGQTLKLCADPAAAADRVPCAGLFFSRTAAVLSSKVNRRACRCFRCSSCGMRGAPGRVDSISSAWRSCAMLLVRQRMLGGEIDASVLDSLLSFD